MVRITSSRKGSSADLIGMMDENKIRNLMTYTYHKPRKPLRATSAKDIANVTVHKIYKGMGIASVRWTRPTGKAVCVPWQAC